MTCQHRNTLACFVLLILFTHLYLVAKTNIFLGCRALLSVCCWRFIKDAYQPRVSACIHPEYQLQTSAPWVTSQTFHRDMTAWQIRLFFFWRTFPVWLCNTSLSWEKGCVFTGDTALLWSLIIPWIFAFEEPDHFIRGTRYTIVLLLLFLSFIPTIC